MPTFDLTLMSILRLYADFIPRSSLVEPHRRAMMATAPITYNVKMNKLRRDVLNLLSRILGLLGISP